MMQNAHAQSPGQKSGQALLRAEFLINGEFAGRSVLVRLSWDSSDLFIELDGDSYCLSAPQRMLPEIAGADREHPATTFAAGRHSDSSPFGTIVDRVVVDCGLTPPAFILCLGEGLASGAEALQVAITHETQDEVLEWLGTPVGTALASH